MINILQWVAVGALAWALYRTLRTSYDALNCIAAWMEKQEKINREVAQALKEEKKEGECGG